MGRPPLPLGTHGEINVTRLGSKRFEARCRFRTRNGAMKRLAARGETAPGARRALKGKLAKHKVTATKGKINRDTQFSEAAKVYKANLRHQVSQRQMSPNTRRAYESVLKTVEGYIGEMRMGELEESVDIVDETIKDIHVTMSYETAKKARTVISAVCQLGIRRHAMTSNPVRSIEALTRGHGTTDSDDDATAGDAVPAMTEAQIQDMFRGLEAFCRKKVEETDRVGRRLGKRGAVWSDLPDLAEASLSTGTRFGEALALTGDDVQPYQDKETGQHRVRININAHLIYDEGKGIRRVPGRKGGRPGILVRVPDWSEAMWLRRKDQAGSQPLFPAVGGGWLDQNNCNKRLRAALDGAGFTWVTARVWRKTLGTLMRRAGRSSEDIAEQLGNTRAVAEKHYIAPPTMTEAGAEVLEMINPPRSAKEFLASKWTAEGKIGTDPAHQKGL